jgi:hypothetical protein
MNGLLIFAIIMVISLVLMEMLKHHFTKSFMKYIVLGVIFIIALLFISATVDLGAFFDKDNTFAKTGSVILDDVRDDVQKINIGDLEVLGTVDEKTREGLHDILDK